MTSALQDIRFVRLAPQHISEVTAIAQVSYPDPWSAALFRAELDNPVSHFYVMLVAGMIAGFGGFWLAADEAEIMNITVKPECRQRGLGKKLLQYLLEQAAYLGAKHAFLEVRESNIPARHLYLTAGFQETGRRKGYYSLGNEDAIVMRRQLPVSSPEQ
jgi:ribosomal-protein-alanine N-acetyltransferase